MSKDLVPQEQKGIDIYRMSTDAANICKAMVVESAIQIQGRKYVRVEGWQAIAIAHGCVASSGEVQKVDGGFTAMGYVRRMSDGIIISQAEGFVGDDEKDSKGNMTWGNRPEYARRAMAQTRAISRACRSAFAHVVVMMNAGLSTTPAEEVPAEGFEERQNKEYDSNPPGRPGGSTPPKAAAPAPPKNEHKEPTATKKPLQTGDENGGTVITYIDTVTEAHGKTAKGSWTRYDIVAGEKYSTFNKDFGKLADAAVHDGVPVSISWEKGKFGRDMTHISLVDSTTGEVCGDHPPLEAYKGELNEK